MHVAELVKALRARPRGAGALLRRAARRGGHDRLRACRPSSRARTPRSQTLGVDLQIVADVAGADVVHSPHLVRELRRASRVAAARHPAHRDRAQPRAAASVEGRAARRRLPAVSSWIEKTAFEGADAVIAVSDGMRARHPALAIPALDPARVRRGLQRHRPRRAGTRVEDPDAAARRSGIDPDRPVGGLRRADHAAEGPAVPAPRGASCCRPTCSSCCARARPTPPQIMAEVDRARRRAAGRRASGVVWIDRHAAAPRARARC